MNCKNDNLYLLSEVVIKTQMVVYSNGIIEMINIFMISIYAIK